MENPGTNLVMLVLDLAMFIPWLLRYMSQFPSCNLGQLFMHYSDGHRFAQVLAGFFLGV